MEQLLQSVGLLLVLLNPFLVIVYLVDLVEKLPAEKFRSVLLRAGVIASLVFCVFVVVGDKVFSSLMQAHFESFQIFGGIVFLLIGLQFVFRGPKAIEILRGESQHIAGAVAMPVLIGPGTISASVLVGQQLDTVLACVAVLVAVFLSVGMMLALKALHDFVRPRNEPLVDRYIEIAGRITALIVGTIAIEMIMRGLQGWMASF